MNNVHAGSEKTLQAARSIHLHINETNEGRH
jgi:hypothetical protein